MNDDIDEPLMGGKGDKKSFSKNCMIPSFIAGVLGVCLLGAVIGIIVMATLPGDNSCDTASSSGTPVTPLVFIEYTADSFLRVCDSFHYHCRSTSKQMLYSFAVGKFCSDQIDSDGNIISRQYSLKQDNSLILCQNLTNHGNCYRVTNDQESLAFSTYGTTLVAKGQPCYTLDPELKDLLPDRKLDKCDYYTMSNIVPLGSPYDTDQVIQVLTESDTGYPVLVELKTFQDASSIARVYKSFIPGKPKDESVLGPLPDTYVYDFRDGENCSDEVTFTMKKDTVEDEHVKAMKRNAAVRKFLNIPVEVGTSSLPSYAVRNTVPRSNDDIPKQFDARNYFSGCKDVIGAVVNQATCQCCWAMSGAAVLADRLCVANQSKGTLSPQYMVFCGKHSFGCEALMMTVDIWKEIVDEGTVTEKCVPYAGRDGECPTLCWDNSNITEDKIYRAKSIVVPWDSDPEARVRAIQTEIMKNGPVQVVFVAFTDLMLYTGGVYQRTKEGKFAGGHAVRLIGWGTTDDGIDYWLVANSWGVQWGEEGLFRIRRGTNECDIEEQVIAGLV